MKPRILATLALVTSSLLLGCEKNPVDNAMQPLASQAAPAARVAVPTGDLSLPATETALQKPKSATDATRDTELTRTERDSQMPLPGQANDHSAPDFAKRGNETAPSKPAK
jgi:hypothetical protein